MVDPQYDGHHRLEHGWHHVFAYHIRILNESEVPFQVIARTWLIIDGEGDRDEVKGPGVVGQFPYLQPGESHAYKSFCPIPTRFGTMEGSFRIRLDDGEYFDATIGRFYLAVPPDHESESTSE